MKLATFNVNSLRRRLSIVVDWVGTNRPDVLCLQETKVQDSEFPLAEMESTGYHVVFRGMKGYNGVALLSRVRPEFVSFGLGCRQYSDEPRLIHAVIKGVPVINTYIPQGFRIDSPKFQYKLDWFKRLRKYFKAHLSPTRPAIWCGDMNVAPDPMDVHSPEKHKNHVCFHKDARVAYQMAMAWGFVDVFRRLYPNRQQYTFWDYRNPNAIEANRGWRIDHILATSILAERCNRVEVDMHPRTSGSPSDHTVLWARFSI